MEKELNLMIESLEKKIKTQQEVYKDRHREDFDKGKMDVFVNRKLEREVQLVLLFNLLPSILVLKYLRKV